MSIVKTHLNKLLGETNSSLWKGYSNQLKILKSMFLSSTHWVLEFIQNAEDAEAKKFSIRLKEDSLWILNDGNKFTDIDFYSICDVNSRKWGLLGYLGVGFKSIFKITDEVEIHSGNFHFMFSQKHWKDEKTRKGPLSQWPWEILPLEISPRELPRGYNTGFYVPLYNNDKLQKALNEIENFLAKNFPGEVILFLKHIETIEIQTVENTFTITKDMKKYLEHPDIESNIVTITKKEEEKADYYLVFRKSIPVPSDIKHDEETERIRRSDVLTREIGIVFRLTDEGKDLRVLEGGISGVYSFLPVEKEQTGLPFGIFGDFIPQPGRDLINYEIQWNKWICFEVVELFKTIVEKIFLPHPQWRVFLLGILEFISKNRGEKFWEDELIIPIKRFLETGKFYPDREGKLRKLDELIMVEENLIKAIGEENLKIIPEGKYLPHYSIKDLLNGIKEGYGIKKLGIYELLQSEEKIEKLKTQPEILVSCYELIKVLSDYYIKGRRGHDKPLSEKKFVLGEDNRLYTPEEVMVIEELPDEIPKFLKPLVFKEKVLLHPLIAKNKSAVNQLYRCGLEIIDTSTFINKVINTIRDIDLPSECPPSWKYPDSLIEATLYILLDIEEKFSLKKLVADNNELVEVNSLFVQGAPLDWYPLWKDGLLPGFHPVHRDYLRIAEKKGKGEKLMEYFRNLNIHGFDSHKDKTLIEKAAEEIVRRRLSEKGHQIADVSDLDKVGYDFLCQGHCQMVFEVKGMKEPHDIELPESEVQAALQKREDYILIFVYNLPAEPEKVKYKEIPNPTTIWRPVDKAIVPKDKWLSNS
ncbi:MAG: sacsin N-terminal ATP-binding-like domain-containing protein [Thermodesulfovibrionales bacterium]